MHEAAMQPADMVFADERSRVVSGAIHFLNRVFPLIFEDKEIFMRALWFEQSFFNNQINATLIMDSIAILLFKPGFCISGLPTGESPKYFGKCQSLFNHH
jgi:hypothetical protein